MTDIDITTEPGRRVSDREIMQLRADFTAHVEQEHEDKKEQHAAQMRNAKAIEDLAAAVVSLHSSVAPIVEIHSEITSAAKLGNRVSDLFVWLAKFGAVGAGMVIAGQWLIEHLPRAH